MSERETRSPNLLGLFVLSGAVTASIIVVATLIIFRAGPGAETSNDQILNISASGNEETLASPSTEPDDGRDGATTVIPSQTSALPPLDPTSTTLGTTTSATTFPPPPPPSPAPGADTSIVRFGRAGCELGLGMIFGGTTRGGFDIVICGDGRGTVEYHGIHKDAAEGIRRPACLWGGTRFEARNSGYRYLVDLDTLPESLIVIGPEGDILRDDDFLRTSYDQTIGSVIC